MTAILCVLFVWHIICSLGAELSIGYNCDQQLQDVPVWPPKDEKAQKEFLKELKKELEVPTWEADKEHLAELDEDVFDKFMVTYKSEYGLNPAELWAIKEYTSNGDFCFQFRSKFRDSCDKLPRRYAKLMYTATHKPNRLDGAPVAAYYIGYRGLKAPPLTTKEDKVNYADESLYGPYSTSSEAEVAITFAGDIGFVLRVKFPKDADVSDVGYLNVMRLSIYKGENERIFWNLPTKYVTYDIINKVPPLMSINILLNHYFKIKEPKIECNSDNHDPKLGIKLGCLVREIVNKEVDALTFNQWCQDVKNGVDAIIAKVNKQIVTKPELRVYILKFLKYAGCPTVTVQDINRALEPFYASQKKEEEQEEKHQAQVKKNKNVNRPREYTLGDKVEEADKYWMMTPLTAIKNKPAILARHKKKLQEVGMLQQSGDDQNSAPMVDYYNHYGGFYKNALLFFGVFIGFMVICICWMMITALLGFILGSFIAKVNVENKENLDESETVDVLTVTE